MVLSHGDDLVLAWLGLATATGESVQAMALHSLASALRGGEVDGGVAGRSDDGAAAAVAKDGERLFAALGAATRHPGDPMAVLLSYLERPFDDLRVAVCARRLTGAHSARSQSAAAWAARSVRRQFTRAAQRCLVVQPRRC